MEVDIDRDCGTDRRRPDGVGNRPQRGPILVDIGGRRREEREAAPEEQAKEEGRRKDEGSS